MAEKDNILKTKTPRKTGDNSVKSHNASGATYPDLNAPSTLPSLYGSKPWIIRFPASA